MHSDRYSPSFYHFKPNKTVLHHAGHHSGALHNNNGSIYKEAIPAGASPDAHFYRTPPSAIAANGPSATAAAAGNSYTGKGDLAALTLPALARGQIVQD